MKHQERRNSVKKTTDLGVELNEEKTATVHNARENTGNEVIGWNVKVNLVMNSFRWKALKMYCVVITLYG